MKIDIQHVEKTKGLIFRKTLHGVALSVVFTGEETAIIEKRKLKNEVVLQRSAPADVDAEKHANRGLVSKIAKAAIAGDFNANNFHLTIGKLMKGTDTYFFDTPLEAKEYEKDLHEVFPDVKAFLMGNASIEKKSGSFEL